MLFRIDPSNGAALFAQIAASVRSDVAAGRLHAGDRLPAARTVAEALGVNLHTVLHAYQLLRDEGLVDMRRGRGAVVTEAATDLASLQTDILALVDKAHALGLPADTLAALVKETIHER